MLILFTVNLFFAVNLLQQEYNPGGSVRFVHHEKHKKINIYINDRLFTIYNYHDSLIKPFFYPIYSPEGIIVTRGYPIEPRPFERIDHPHQTGCWFNFGDVNGLDFWNNSFAIPRERLDRYGRITKSQIIDLKQNEDHGIVEVKMDWVNSNNDRILSEHTRFIIIAEKRRWMLDRITTLIAEDENIHLGDNKEGLFALRVARAFESPSDKPVILTDEYSHPSTLPVMNNEGVNGYFTGSNGLEGKEVWGTQNRWVSLSAFAGGDSISIIILDHPENFGFPSYWHARDYGLFSVNNLGRKAYNKNLVPVEMNLAKGDSCIFRHRLVISSMGFLKKDEIENIFKEFSQEYHK